MKKVQILTYLLLSFVAFGFVGWLLVGMPVPSLVPQKSYSGNPLVMTEEQRYELTRDTPANKLLESCRAFVQTDGPEFRENFCAGYMMAVADSLLFQEGNYAVLQAMNPDYNGPEASTCFPSQPGYHKHGQKPSELVSVMLEEDRRQAVLSSDNAYRAAEKALASKFPCKELQKLKSDNP